MSMEAGKYHIGQGMNAQGELTPITWKRADDGLSYRRLFYDEQQAEFAQLEARRDELTERARLDETHTRIIGNTASTLLYDTEGDQEAVVFTKTDDDSGEALLFHPVEWQAFVLGVKDSEFNQDL